MSGILYKEEIDLSHGFKFYEYRSVFYSLESCRITVQDLSAFCSRVYNVYATEDN